MTVEEQKVEGETNRTNQLVVKEKKKKRSRALIKKQRNKNTDCHTEEMEGKT